MNNAGENSKVARKVIFLTTGQIFISSAEASKFANMNRSSLNKVYNPNHYTRFTDKHPETGEKLEWMYYDEYLSLKEGKEDISSNEDTSSNNESEACDIKRILYRTTGKTFNSTKEASEFYRVSESVTERYCIGRRSFADIDVKSREKLVWGYTD